MSRPWSIWRQAAVRVWTRISPEDVQIRAAGVAFYGFLALLPGLLGVVELYGTLADPVDVREQLAALAPLFPAEVSAFLASQLAAMAEHSRASLGLGAVGTLGFGIWGASKGTRALLHTLGTSARGVDVRGRVRRGARALALSAGAVLVVALAVAVMIVFPSLLAPLGRESAATKLVGILRWPALAGSVFGWMTMLYRSRPGPAGQTWRWNLLGAAVATTLWLLASVLFSTFVGRSGGKDVLYGSLAAAVMLLTWFLLAAYAVLVGAEVADAARWATSTSAAGAASPQPLAPARRLRSRGPGDDGSRPSTGGR